MIKESSLFSYHNLTKVPPSPNGDSGLSLSVVADATVEAREDTGASPSRWSKTSKASKVERFEWGTTWLLQWSLRDLDLWNNLVEWNHDGTYEKIFWNKRFFEDNKGRVGIPPIEVVFSWGDPGIKKDSTNKKPDDSDSIHFKPL